MAHRGPIIGSLKRLLMCTRTRRRSKTVIRDDGNTPPSRLATVSTTTNCLDSSPDSLNCQTRLTTTEFKRRRGQNQLRVSRDFSESDVTCIKGDDSDTVRTLSSGTTEAEISCRGTEAPQNTAVTQTSLSCHAEIFSLETIDHCAKVQDAMCDAVTRTDALVVTEYRTECRMSDERPKVVVNNALIFCHRQLNVELCEVNWPQTAQIEALHVSNNLTNFSQYQPGKCSAIAHQDACQRSPLRVHVLSEESEPRSTCASITTSEPPSVEPLPSGCWPDGDAVGPDEVQVDAAECKRPSGDAETAKFCDTACDGVTDPIRSSEKSHKLSPENPYPYPAISRTENALPEKSEHANDRFGTLSSELCASLRRGLRGDDLIQRYLEKRDISDTVRARHRQRCGSISASVVDRILRKSGEAASGTTAAAAAAATLRDRLPKDSSATATELSDHTVFLSIAPSEREIRSAPVVSIVASVAAAANAIAAVAKEKRVAASASVATTAGRTRTPEGAGGGTRRRKACLATSGPHAAAKILIPVVMNLRARQRVQRAA